MNTTVDKILDTVEVIKIKRTRLLNIDDDIRAIEEHKNSLERKYNDLDSNLLNDPLVKNSFKKLDLLKDNYINIKNNGRQIPAPKFNELFDKLLKATEKVMAFNWSTYEHFYFENEKKKAGNR